MIDERDPARIDRMLALLRTHWRRHPDQRLGQVVVNLTPPDRDPFYVEDDELEEALGG